MEINRHYKLFKKGKNWCTMALTTFAVVTGIALTTGQTAKADSVSNVNNVTDQLQQNITTQDSNNSSVKFVENNSTNVEENTNKDSTVEDNKSQVEDNTNNQSIETNSNTNGIDQKDATNTVDVNKTNTSVAKESSVSLYQSNYDGWRGNQYYQNGNSLKNTTADIDGNTYYFDANGNMVKDYFLTQNGKDYYFDASGKMAKDYFLNRWGANYYYGLDGARYTNQFFNRWGATYYYGDGGVRYTDQFMNRWGANYYFGLDGARYTNQFFSRWGATYYYGDGGVRYTDQFMNRWGANYYFGNDGALYKNKFLSRWGATYYYGDDGVRWDNTFMSAWGKIYYFGNDGARVTNRTINLGFGDLTFDGNGILTDSNSFIGSIVNGAIRGWTEHGVLPSLTLSQAIIESGWGRSVLASQYHNLFGIKGSYNGQSVNMPTYENYGNGLVLINDNFRAYPDNDASVEDHANFLVDNSRYSNLLWDSDSNSVTYKIRADGYATATNYTYTLRNAISTYDLTRFDQVAFRARKANL